jgi:hypothetical protein
MPEFDTNDVESVAGDTPRLIVTLVHGTWGRGFIPGDFDPCRSWRTYLPFKWFVRSPRAPWFHPTAPFHRKLQTLARCEVRSFSWCGSNSVFARSRAAKALKRLLESDPANTRHVIVAHSHGGNVALQALNKIGKTSDIRVVTLATPFIRVIPRWWDPTYLDALLPTLLSMIWLAVYLGPSFGLPLKFLSQGPLWLVDYLLTAIIAAIPILLLSTFAVRFVVNAGPANWTIPNDKSFFQWRPHRLALANNYTCDTSLGPKLLVLRGIDDEAGLALAFGAIGARLSHAIRGLIAKKILVAAVLLTPATAIVLGYFGFTFRAALILPVAVLMLMLTPGFFNSVFGREFAFGAVRCEIASNSSPDSEHLKVVTLPEWDSDVKTGLRHSIYDHPDCVSQIVLWLCDEGVITDLQTKTAFWMQDWARRMRDRVRETGGDPIAERIAGPDAHEELMSSLAVQLAVTAIQIQDQETDRDAGTKSP